MQLTLEVCRNIPPEALRHLVHCRQLRRVFVTRSSLSACLNEAELARFTPGSSAFDAASFPHLSRFHYEPTHN
jgi:hypothetical protein